MGWAPRSLKRMIDPLMCDLSNLFNRQKEFYKLFGKNLERLKTCFSSLVYFCLAKYSASVMYFLV